MAQEAKQVHTWFWWGCLTERDHLEELRVEGKIILKYLFKKHNGGWTGLSDVANNALNSFVYRDVANNGLNPSQNKDVANNALSSFPYSDVANNALNSFVYRYVANNGFNSSQNRDARGL